jgi:DNA-binding beta-propeller fold protein YncE
MPVLERFSQHMVDAAAMAVCAQTNAVSLRHNVAINDLIPIKAFATIAVRLRLHQDGPARDRIAFTVKLLDRSGALRMGVCTASIGNISAVHCLSRYPNTLDQSLITRVMSTFQAPPPPPTAADNRFAFVADLGLDKVLVYQYDASAGTLIAHAPGTVSLAPGSGPRHFSFSPSGQFAYVNGEMTSTVNAYSYDKEAGIFATLNSLPTLPEGGHEGNSTAEVVVSPDGKHVYVSNRGHDSVAIFGVNADGSLSAKGHQTTGGETPRNFAIDPTGTFLLAANQRSNTVVSFRIDPATGALTPTGHSVAVPAPVCVRYFSR